MRYGMFLRGAVGVLLVTSGVGCDKWEEESLTPEVEQQGFISLQEVAQLLSAVPLEREQVLEVQEATGSSAGNGYDEEYRMRDLFTAPGCGVGESASTKAGKYSRPLRELLREAARERFATKADGGDPEAWLDSLAVSDVQIYWPGAAAWDGESLPVVTYDPGDGAERNEGYELLPGGNVRAVMVDEQMSRERPVWVVNRNSDADYKSLEMQRKEDPLWGTGGGDILVRPTKAEGEVRTLVVRSLRALRQYDSWFSGGSEFWLKIGAVEKFKAATEADIRQYDPTVTDFMIVVRRSQLEQEIPLNAVLVSEWTLQLASAAFMMVEDDGGTRTTWKASTTVKYNSKSYGIELEIPLNSRDDIVWRGTLSAGFIEKNNGKPVRLGDVELVLELI